MLTVFLSHSSKDKAFARQLAEALTGAGVLVWIDEAELKIGDSLLTKISTAIAKVDFVIVVLSRNSVQSNWVASELKMAMTRELSDEKVRVLPVIVDDCEIPLFLKDKVYADFRHPDTFVKSINLLVHALGVSQTARMLDTPVVDVSVQSDTADESRNSLPAQTSSSIITFVDIKIVGVDKQRTCIPDTSYALYNVYFELSQAPTWEWIHFFDAARKSPRHNMWRRAWIEGRYVVVNCALDEIKRYHLSDITDDVTTANANHRERLRLREIERLRKEAEKEREKKDIDDALDGLQFAD